MLNIINEYKYFIVKMCIFFDMTFLIVLGMIYHNII